MTPDDPNSAAAVIGSVVAAISGIILAAWKGGFFKSDDHGRGDLHAKFDKLDDKLDAVRDRLTSLEASAREIQRRVDRLDR